MQQSNLEIMSSIQQNEMLKVLIHGKHFPKTQVLLRFKNIQTQDQCQHVFKQEDAPFCNLTSTAAMYNMPIK